MGKSRLSHSYDREENKKSHRESDVRKGRQPDHVSDIDEHVGSSMHHHGNKGEGIRFKLPEDAEISDHSVVVRGHLKE